MNYSEEKWRSRRKEHRRRRSRDAHLGRKQEVNEHVKGIENVEDLTLLSPPPLRALDVDSLNMNSTT